MIGHTSDEDKIALVNWFFSVLASHPDIKGLHSVNFNQNTHNGLDKKMANLVVSVFNSCQYEIEYVMDYEGDIALEEAFSVWVEIAFMSLSQNDEVQRNGYSYMKHIDLSRLKIDMQRFRDFGLLE